MLLHDILLRAERFHGSRLAIVDGGIRRSYAELAARARRAAAALRGAGLRSGDHVAVLADNGGRFVEAYFACSLAGLVAVPVNSRLAAPEVAFILDDAQVRAVLFDAAYAALVPADTGRVHVLLGDAPAGSTPAWDTLIAGTDPSTLAIADHDEDALAHVCYTGGTTGRPKGVMLSHRNVVASTVNKIVLGAFQRDDVWLHAAPMFHQADSWACFAFTLLGAAHVLIPRFEAGDALDLIERHRVTATQVVPTMILMLLDAAGIERRDVGSVRRILYGSAPMPVDHLRRAQAVFGPVFQHIYGLTEAAGTVAATPWPMAPHETDGERRASCGQPVAGTEVRIAGADDEVETGGVGNILVRGPTVMRGYWRREAETAETLRGGWLDTGDVGRMDADGFLFVVDRARDTIITGGENVYPSEVENALCSHPQVAEAAVIGIPDDTWGEAVTAFVVPRADADLEPGTVLAHCRERLARYKCPKTITVVAALPRTPAGKIAKTALRSAPG